MKVTDLFPSHFIKSFDLESDLDLTIKGVQLEEHGFGKKIKSACVYFNETEKCLGLNKTNATTIASLHGGETDNWPGKRITLYPTSTNFQGRPTPCIRIRERAPSQANSGTAQHTPPPPTQHNPDTLPDNLRKRFHAVGTECYGSEWDEKRPELVKSKTKGRTASSNGLTPDEALHLIQGMERKIHLCRLPRSSRPGSAGPRGEEGVPGIDPSWSAQTRAALIVRLKAATSAEGVNEIENDFAPIANQMTDEDSNSVLDRIIARRDELS